MGGTQVEGYSGGSGGVVGSGAFSGVSCLIRFLPGNSRIMAFVRWCAEVGTQAKGGACWGVVHCELPAISSVVMCEEHEGDASWWTDLLQCNAGSAGPEG